MSLDRPAGTRLSSARSILIVDDVPGNLQVVTTELEAHGYTALVARGGQEALERAAFARPDLILLDVAMPGIDGFETCRRLKASARTRDIPVIFMTAKVSIDNKLTAFQLGAVDYVTKPLNTSEVLARVETHLTLSALRQELTRQNEQLRSEVAAREATQAALERSNADLEQLAYVASHDMQEPLRMIASYLQLIERRYGDQLDADGHEFIGYAVDGAKRMQALINDMLAYSRVATKGRALAPVESAAIMKVVREHLRLAIEEAGAEIEQGELPRVHGDAAQLVQLLQNLVSNAIKFRGASPPRIRIDCTSDADGWCFSVRDNGIGIAPEHSERIFGMFERLHARSAYPGTGIGLALCKRIVERHGGRLWVEPAEGGGSVFRFTLPRAAA
jgi:two-component system, sensor histidine kinase and response regulator